MWQSRDDEPTYALLNDKTVADNNRYGAPIDLIARSGGVAPKERELRINEAPGVGANPNRNKQHAFHFTADNCIGCHACEAACSEKNDNPAHISFRSVGFVEGGSYPDYRRLNISMACNHCDDPVCLKGCPTRAYTKHAEYGAVLQDPDTCFGCGYCTWVCPYNAPQLDPIKGQVSKCNMCVDRLEEGLKPACVSACLGNALNFGVVENVPENRQQAEIAIPGFPDPSITQPNIRFQQRKKLPDEVTRPDGMPVKYRKDADGGYRPVVDQKKGKQRSWNLRKLSSRENPLVVFTLATQAALGAFLTVFLGSRLGVAPLQALAQSAMYVPLLLLMASLVAGGLFMSTIHLGKPLRFYRGFNNLRHSPVCREGLGVAVFLGCIGLHMLLMVPDNPALAGALGGLPSLRGVADLFGALAIPAGLTGLYYMYRCYRIPARPFWNHWQTATSFVGSCLSLGAVLVGIVGIPTLWVLGEQPTALVSLLAGMALMGTVIEGIGLRAHAKAMNIAANEGGASHYIQCTTFGKTYRARNVLLALNALLLLGLMLWNPTGWAMLLWGLPALSLVLAAMIGRALFYVLVVPTTMPGAFFWKNKDFEQHARDIGLANLPQVGVVPEAH